MVCSQPVVHVLNKTKKILMWQLPMCVCGFCVEIELIFTANAKKFVPRVDYGIGFWNRKNALIHGCDSDNFLLMLNLDSMNYQESYFGKNPKQKNLDPKNELGLLNIIE